MLNLELSLERICPETKKHEQEVLMTDVPSPGKYVVGSLELGEIILPGGYVDIKNPQTASDLRLRQHLGQSEIELNRTIRQLTILLDNYSPDYFRGSKEKAERRIDLNRWGIGRMQLSPDLWLVVEDKDAPKPSTSPNHCSMKMEITRDNCRLDNRQRTLTRYISS
jgi:hypothetical protein